MTREEFKNKAKLFCDDTGVKFNEPNDNDWKIIEYVSIYHPRIQYLDYGEDQIAYLYAKFGMSVIKDMEGAARSNANK